MVFNLIRFYNAKSNFYLTFQVVSFDAEWKEVYVGYAVKNIFTGTILVIYLRETFIIHFLVWKDQRIIHKRVFLTIHFSN